ncbi:MAG: hypothetical protein K9K79_07785 [Desulfohalobiaceae bacterium]|nr:hypothetical protein [Desulfohalobiaceae bacterium]
MANQNPKKKSAPRESGKTGQNERTTLDDVLVALQKSFSRVSSRSADVSSEQARAMVSGQVHFDISLKVNLEGDYLHPDTRGDIDLNLSGDIETDIRMEEE